jgi:hypothetical protein
MQSPPALYNTINNLKRKSFYQQHPTQSTGDEVMQSPPALYNAIIISRDNPFINSPPPSPQEMK